MLQESSKPLPQAGFTTPAPHRIARKAHAKSNLQRVIKRATAFAVSAVLCSSVSSSALAIDEGDHTGVTDKEILIGSCSALSGPASFLGTQQLIGARSYINYVNDQGGINGRKVKLVTHDDGYEPSRAIACFHKVIEEKAFAAAFFVGTPTAAKYVPMAEVNKIPILGLYTGAQLLHEPFRPRVISIRASYYDETREQVEGLWTAGHRKFGVIYQEDAFGAAVLEGVKRALAAHRAAPVSLGSFARNTLDVQSAIDVAKAGNPDVVVLVGAYAPEAEILKRARTANWKPQFTTVSFVGTEALIKAAGKDADGVIVTQVVPPYTRDNLPTALLYKKLLKQYFPNEAPNFTSMEGFVDAMVLCEGLKRAGKDLTRAKFISAIENIHNWDIGLGKQTISYSPTRHKGFDAVFPIIIKSGKPELLTSWSDVRVR